MTDFLDRAQALEIATREAALARIRAQVTTGPTHSHCHECGSAIPTARQQAMPGCTTCIRCQEVIDSRRRK